MGCLVKRDLPFSEDAQLQTGGKSYVMLKKMHIMLGVSKLLARVKVQICGLWYTYLTLLGLEECFSLAFVTVVNTWHHKPALFPASVRCRWDVGVCVCVWVLSTVWGVVIPQRVFSDAASEPIRRFNQMLKQTDWGSTFWKRIWGSVTEHF